LKGFPGECEVGKQADLKVQRGKKGARVAIGVDWMGAATLGTRHEGERGKSIFGKQQGRVRREGRKCQTGWNLAG